MKMRTDERSLMANTDFLSLLATLDGENIAVTLESGREATGVLSLDHVPFAINDTLDWHKNVLEPVILLRWRYSETGVGGEDYWIRISQIAMVSKKPE